MPSPKDTKGPIVETGPTKGKNRSRNSDGTWRKKRSDSGKKRDKESDSGCFITSAACQYRGLPDDCHQLMVLRGFRDQVLMASTDGQSLVEQYYEKAPKLASKLNDESDFNYVWSSICSCVGLIESKQYDEATVEYSNMFIALSEKFK